MTPFEWFIVASILAAYGGAGVAAVYAFRKITKLMNEVSKYKRTADKLVSYFKKIEPFIDFILGEQ